MEPSIRRDRSLLGDCAVYLLSALDRGQNDINRPEEGSKAGTARCPAVPVTDALQFLNNGVDIVGQLRALAAVHWGCRPWSPDWSPSGAMQRYVGNRGSSRPARLALETTS
jgi:hypothetical protein